MHFETYAEALRELQIVQQAVALLLRGHFVRLLDANLGSSERNR